MCELAAGRLYEKSFIYHGFAFQPYSFFIDKQLPKLAVTDR